MPTALIVEDDAGVRDYLSRAMATHGWQTVCISRPEEALHVAATRPFQLVVVDVMLPGMTGCEFASRFSPGHEQTPVLFISGYPRQYLHDRVNLPRSGAFLHKPFTLGKLFDQVDRLLRQSKGSAHEPITCARRARCAPC